MFDNLTSKKEDNLEEEVTSETKTDSSFGNFGNVPANLSPNPSPSLTAATGDDSPVVQVAKQSLGEEFDQRMQKLEAKGKKRGIRFSKIGLIIGSLIALAMMGIGYYMLTDVIGISEKAQESITNIPNIGRQNGENKTATELPILTDTMRACTVDEDCTIAQESCCSCDKGGIQTGISLSLKDSWDKTLKNKCASADCGGEGKCLEGRAYCDEMICKFKEEIKNCKDEGETFVDTLAEEMGCCNNLQKLRPRVASVDGSCVSFTDEAVCINCGDGICGTGEDACNCLADCTSEEGLMASSTDALVEGILEGEVFDCVGSDCSTDQVVDPKTTTDQENIWVSNPNFTDSDGDGLSNADEAKYGTDLNNRDTDGDGFSDGSEVENGYNPLGEGKLN